MSAQVERDAGAPLGARDLEPPGSPAIAPATFDPDIDSGSNLPSDHPAWNRDRLILSLRARELLARLKPVAIRVLHFWDHHVRSIFIAGRSLSIDGSGSYRFE